MTMYWVDVGFACGGVDVEGNRIVAVPPIFNGWRGRSWSTFKAYYKAKVVEVG